MTVFNLSERPSVANRFLSELRDINIQKDRMRFRRNMERLGEVLAYELSKSLPHQPRTVETPLGQDTTMIPDGNMVIATILRAGLPLQQGVLNYFDEAAGAFVSAYRMHHKSGGFEIKLEYISCPDLNGCTLVLTDPMLATGASAVLALKELMVFGKPASVHLVTAIASTQGLEYLQRMYPYVHVWMGALDEELTAKSYIVPGLGDAGDLSFGPKLQE